jgi:single-stranded-DNA-specific exonuclease
MADLEKFGLRLKEAVDKLNQIDKSETFRVISHLDSDGICAASLLLKALNIEKRKYSLSIVQQLDEKTISSLSEESYTHFIFTDIGSGQLDLINKHLSGRTIFILDHHDPAAEAGENIMHVNPHLFGINGSNEISGAGVVFMFAETLNPKLAEFAHLALIGAIGDIQDEGGSFSELNRSFISKAVEAGKLKVIKGLRLFGAQTKPLHKILEYSSSPSIPGVSGSESGAIQFLRQIGIEPKEGNQWRKLVNLSQPEIERLTDGIIMKLLESDTPINPEDIIGEVYILREEEKESPLRDAKEFSTMLNACGRMGKSSVGIGACLGDSVSKQNAIRVLGDYKREIVRAMEWYEQNKLTHNVIMDKGLLIINAHDQIKPTIIGTMASIISKSSSLPDKTFILSMARNDDGSTKVSMRIAGNGNSDVDLNTLVSRITEKIGAGKGGGHMHASGAVIPSDKEEDFISHARIVLGQLSMEEKVL